MYTVPSDLEKMTGRRMLSGEEGKKELLNLITTMIDWAYSTSDECFALSMDIHAGVKTPHQTEIYYKLNRG
jgi:hypothetical protein